MFVCADDVARSKFVFLLKIPLLNVTISSV